VRNIDDTGYRQRMQMSIIISDCSYVKNVQSGEMKGVTNSGGVRLSKMSMLCKYSLFRKRALESDDSRTRKERGEEEKSTWP